MTPSLAHRNEYPSGFWSKNCNHVGNNQLQKFWSELSPRARRELLRIDKQTLFEQARKNMYCSRCNGLLLECFSQIVTYGKSLRHEGLNGNTPGNADALENQGDCDLVMSNGCPDETQDPAVYQWGGLTTTRDGLLTLLTCYLYAKSFKGLQKVFDGARDRERESEVLYPDACGVGGRGWISQGMMNYGRGLGAREKCALHTARLSCDTLVDFWSALGEETRQSLLKMKEEDFIERLTYRFDSKRFCRDCRRNVIREFKELKELKRMRREPRCTTRFCAADTAFEYEVSIDAVQADWRQTFPETVGTYHHFEWAIGTEEGKSDILEFQNVGMSRNVQVTGLNLRGFSACYITLKAYKSDGRCSKICVKAHALRVQQCVHRILEVGDGYVSIKRGESVRELFEHAEEAEEEEDDDLMDRDGNELDGDCSRPQKHAKSPELAREFLLDAATVIFKEHVEKAFREGTARQNAHNIFVCLGLKLLEERFHVAFKEIITLEKQMKLLEEEEKEKREEEERKERKRTKEREKKLRRKERLKEKEKGKETDDPESNKCSVLLDEPEQQSLDSYEDPSNNISCNDSAAETADVLSSSPLTPGNQDEQISDGSSTRAEEQCCDSSDTQVVNLEDEKCSFMTRQSTQVHRAKCWGETQPDPSLNWSSRRRYGENASYVGRSESRYHNYRFEVKPRCFNGSNRQLRTKPPKSNNPNGMNCNEKFQCCSTRAGERYDFQPCSCKHNDSTISANKSFEPRNSLCKSDSAREVSPKSKPALGQNRSLKDSFSVKKVWAPMETKKSPPCNSDSELTLRSSGFEAEGKEHVKIKAETPKDMSPCEVPGSLASISHKEGIKKSYGDCSDLGEGNLQKEVHVEGKNCWHSTNPGLRSSSSSDNCCSCLSDGSFSNSGKTESSSTSDSEGVAEGQDNNPVCVSNGFSVSHEKQMDNGGIQHSGRSFMASGNNNRNDAVVDINTDSQHPGIFPPIINQFVQFPVFQPAPTISYYHQSPDSWLTTASAAGLTHYPHPNQYLYAGGHLGYSLNGEDSHLCMQYGVPPHHSVSPFVDSLSIPVFHEQGKANGVNTEETAQILEPKSTHKPVNGSEMGVKTVKPDNGNGNCFSLFHFDGPVSLSSQVSAADAVASDHNAWESEIEEYNLFAANKGLNLSFL